MGTCCRIRFQYLLESGGLLEELPDAIALLDLNLRILWCNAKVESSLPDRRSRLIGEKFYDAFGTPEILGPDFLSRFTQPSGRGSRRPVRFGSVKNSILKCMPSR